MERIMGFDDYIDRVDLYWQTANADWDLDIDEEVADQYWKIDQSFTDTRPMNEEVESLDDVPNDGLPFYFPHQDKIEELSVMEPKELACMFALDIRLLGYWIAQHPDMPQRLRIRLLGFLEALNISHRNTKRKICIEIGAIKDAQEELRYSNEYRKYILALSNWEHMMHHFKDLVDAWDRQKHQLKGHDQQKLAFLITINEAQHVVC